MDSLVSAAAVEQAYNAHASSQMKAFVNLYDGPHNEPCNKEARRHAAYEVRFIVAHLVEGEKGQLDTYFFSSSNESLCHNTENQRASCLLNEANAGTTKQ